MESKTRSVIDVLESISDIRSFELFKTIAISELGTDIPKQQNNNKR